MRLEEQIIREFDKKFTRGGKGVSWSTIVHGTPSYAKQFILSKLKEQREEVYNSAHAIGFRDGVLAESNKRKALSVDENTSDGYHTFKELYEHRVLLWINIILLQHLDLCYLVEDHYEGWFLLGIETYKGQISYHCPNKYLFLCKNITRRQPKFDGHTSNDVIGRLKDLAKDNIKAQGGEK